MNSFPHATTHAEWNFSRQESLPIVISNWFAQGSGLENLKNQFKMTNLAQSSAFRSHHHGEAISEVSCMFKMHEILNTMW